MTTDALKPFLADLRRLTAPGTLGFYRQLDVVQIVGMRQGVLPFNVLTVLVAEESAEPIPPGFICDRIVVRGIESVKFGVFRSSHAVETISAAVERASQGEDWNLGSGPLRFSRLVSIPPVLVPRGADAEVPLNAILKNNFWDGSYVLELFDETKQLVSDLLSHPPRLMELSEAIPKEANIRLAGLSDRLGNVVVQLPIDVFRSRSRYREGGLQVELAWHPAARPRPVEAHATARRDGIITAHCSVQLDGASTTLPLGAQPDPYTVTLWDPTHQMALGTMDNPAPIHQASFQIGVSGAGKRLLTLPDGQRAAVSIRHGQPPTVLGEARPHLRWTIDRLYAAEESTLAASRRFRQYSAGQPQQTDRTNAIGDLRYLVEAYGEHGVWLWDPYLSAVDILNTLFFNPHAGAPMRALASARRASGLATQDNLTWMATQAAHLSNCNCNYEDLNLEYRALHGNPGWDFHDRFLIFPNFHGRALAWSLGTSVNQAGGSHHILQQVDNARLVAEAFDDLWNALGKQQFVWSWPIGRANASAIAGPSAEPSA
jgi:hypothetical protein